MDPEYISSRLVYQCYILHYLFRQLEPRVNLSNDTVYCSAFANFDQKGCQNTQNSLMVLNPKTCILTSILRILKDSMLMSFIKQG